MVKSECPAFGRGWDPDVDNCMSCGEDTPDEFEACKNAVKQKIKKGDRGMSKKGQKEGKVTNTKKVKKIKGTKVGTGEGKVSSAKETAEELYKKYNKDKDGFVNAMAGVYVKAGRDKEWAKKRASHLYRVVKK